MMETDLIRTFLTVVRSGSFTEAARELGYVQSTVSAQLQALERRLGTRLVDRLPSGALPNEAGIRLAGLAEDLLGLEDRILREVRPGDDQPRGHVRILAPESLCAHRLPPLLREVRTTLPEVRMSLAPAGSTAALAAVRRGVADVVVVLENSLSAPDLDVEKVGSEELVHIGPVDTAPVDVLLLEEGCVYSDEVARRLLAVGHPESSLTRFGSVEAVKACVSAGLGTAVVPRVAAAADIDTGAVRVVEGRLPGTPHVFLVTLGKRSPTPATGAVLELLRGLWR
jgi:DNA-binding transcriptional LysR family regulator